MRPFAFLFIELGVNAALLLVLNFSSYLYALFPRLTQVVAVTRRLAVAWMHGKDALTQNRQLEIEMSALLLMSRARLQAEIIVCCSAALSDVFALWLRKTLAHIAFVMINCPRFSHSAGRLGPTVVAAETLLMERSMRWMQRSN